MPERTFQHHPLTPSWTLYPPSRPLGLLPSLLLAALFLVSVSLATPGVEAKGGDDGAEGGTVLASLVLLGLFLAYVGYTLLTRPKGPAWEGFRRFRVVDKVLETADMCSFYLAPVNGKRLRTFPPGQYLTLRLELPGQERPLVRCYSLSSASDPQRYRITVKRVGPPRDEPRAPPGLVSNQLHDHVQPGDELEVKAPRGAFTLDPRASGPVVLIGGGVGLTPILTMAETLALKNPTRPTWLFLGVRNGQEHPFRERLQELAARCPGLDLQVCYSAPRSEDRPGLDYHHDGRISHELMARTLPGLQLNYYLCGPPPMMNSLPPGLEGLGVSASRIHMEAFGPASRARPASRPPGTCQSFTVDFVGSGQEVEWDGSQANLLELAEAHGLDLDHGCRIGNCGTCEVELLQGTVDSTDSGAIPAPGCCLACVSVPTSDIQLDA